MAQPADIEEVSVQTPVLAQIWRLAGMQLMLPDCGLCEVECITMDARTDRYCCIQSQHAEDMTASQLIHGLGLFALVHLMRVAGTCAKLPTLQMRSYSSMSVMKRSRPCLERKSLASVLSAAARTKTFR